MNFLLVVAGLWVFVELYSSDPEVEHGDVDPKEPFSLPFEISNPHYFPLLILERRCIVSATYKYHSELNQQLVLRGDLNEQIPLTYRGRTSYRCRFFPWDSWKTLAVRMLIRYKLGSSLVPFTMTSRQDFRMVRDFGGTIHWSNGLDPDQEAPEFLEYPIPAGPASARFYCDVDKVDILFKPGIIDGKDAEQITACQFRVGKDMTFRGMHRNEKVGNKMYTAADVDIAVPQVQKRDAE